MTPAILTPTWLVAFRHALRTISVFQQPGLRQCGTTTFIYLVHHS